MAKVWVNGYYKKDGKWVDGYYRISGMGIVAKEIKADRRMQTYLGEFRKREIVRISKQTGLKYDKDMKAIATRNYKYDLWGTKKALNKLRKHKIF